MEEQRTFWDPFSNYSGRYLGPHFLPLLTYLERTPNCDLGCPALGLVEPSVHSLGQCLREAPAEAKGAASFPGQDVDSLPHIAGSPPQ